MAIRDREATRSRVLAAALEEFAEKGIAGARVDEIAARAGVNKRMLYYYFGSKEGLSREIRRHRLLSTTDALRQERPSDPDRLSRRYQRVADSEQYVRLLMWEALENRGEMLEDEEPRQALYDEWVASIRAQQEAGLLPADLEARQLLLSEIALTLFPIAFPQLTRLVTGESPSDPGFIRRRRRFLSALGRRLSVPVGVDTR